jgi:hypothetical protein
MGQLTITQTIAGTLDEAISKTFKTSIPCSSGSDFTHTIGATWTGIASTSQFSTYQTIVLLNTGSFDALYRVYDGTNYARGTLPAGRGIVIHLSSLLAHGGATTNTNKTLAVWASASTSIRVITLY